MEAAGLRGGRPRRGRIPLLGLSEPRLREDCVCCQVAAATLRALQAGRRLLGRPGYYVSEHVCLVQRKARAYYACSARIVRTDTVLVEDFDLQSVRIQNCLPVVLQLVVGTIGCVGRRCHQLGALLREVWAPDRLPRQRHEDVLVHV